MDYLIIFVVVTAKNVVMYKNEGFKGQKSIVPPGQVIERLGENCIAKSLYFTDIGYYPAAGYHLRKRDNGCKQHILLYCVDGEGWVMLNNKKYILKPNQFIIIPIDTPHSYGADIKNPWTIYWVHFVGENSSYFAETNSVVNDITPDETSRQKEREELFYEIFKNADMGYSEENLIYANTCLQHFLLSLKFPEQFRLVKKHDRGDIVENSINYMRENISEKLSLENLADKSGLSSSHYSLKFKKRTSSSPLDYFINLKMQHACQLLDYSSFRINQIALKVGYDDAYYFSRIFKKVMGVSPIEYRKNGKG